MVYWDCEEVKVPFSSLEDTSLVMMLCWIFLQARYNNFGNPIEEGKEKERVH